MNTLTIIAIIALSLVGLLLVLNVLVMPILRRKAEQKREKKLSITVAGFKKGDKILLVSGIRAIFIKTKGDVIYVEIAEKVIIKVDKHAVMGVYK